MTGRKAGGRLSSAPQQNRHRRRRRLKESEWEEVKRLYLASPLTLAEIARRFGIAPVTISSHRRAHDWPKRPPLHRRRNAEQAAAPRTPFGDASGSALLTRLVAALERQIRQTESLLGDEAAEALSVTAADRERDARTLASLARTLEKLEELRRLTEAPAEAPAKAEGLRPGPQTENGSADHLRAQLERRLDQLLAASGAAGVSEKPE